MAERATECFSEYSLVRLAEFRSRSIEIFKRLITVEVVGDIDVREEAVWWILL